MFNSKVVLVVAPHTDDETLGCGGTLLRLIEEGVEVHWLIITSMDQSYGYSAAAVKERQLEISEVSARYNFKSVHKLGFQPANLDAIAKSEIICEISAVISEVRPEVLFVPYRNDAHSDHEIVYDAVMASSKSFRYPFIKKIYAYETLSETDFGLKPEDGGFRPNVFVGIEEQLESKLSILELFKSEMGSFPFPRSRKAIESLAHLRGVQCNYEAAESFMLIKEIL